MNATKYTVKSQATNQYQLSKVQKVTAPTASQAPVAQQQAQKPQQNEYGYVINPDGTTTVINNKKPSTGNQTNTNSQKGVNASVVDKTYHDSLSNDYGWKGQWQTSKDGFNKASVDDTILGYAEDAITWSGDKNPNKTLGKGMASATHDVRGDEINKYKYGYTHTTATPSENGSDFTSHTDYYFWN